MYSFRTILIIFLIAANALLGKAQRNADYSPDLKQLHENIWIDILKGSTNNDKIKKITGQLSNQGVWPDIDYASKQRGNWYPAGHLSKLQTMAKAWQRPGSTYYHDTSLLAKIHLALNYWLNNDFQYPNWWYPQIGVPISQSFR